jgi:hypothetical protein
MVPSGKFEILSTKTSINSFLSVLVLQWLINTESSHPTMSPPHRLMRFFTTLYATLKNPSRAVLQCVPPTILYSETVYHTYHLD